MLDKGRAKREGLLNLGIDYQIHIPLAVTQIGISQTMKFLGKGKKGF